MKTVTQTKKEHRKRRHARIRSTVKGTADKPRLAVFKSNRYTNAQLIDDTAQKTIASATSRGDKAGTEVERAKAVGAKIAAVAKEKGVTKAVFDRGGFIYTGRIRAVAEGAREGGLAF